MNDETAGDIRTLIRRVNMKNFKDDGETMTASVEVAEGIWRDDVEVPQAYGSAAYPPEDGAMGIALAVGGDEGDMVIIAVTNPSKRLGGLTEGEVSIYNGDGDKMVITPDGNINVSSGTALTVKTPKATVDAPVVDLGTAGRTPAAGINHLVHVTFGSSTGMHPIVTGSPDVNIKE